MVDGSAITLAVFLADGSFRAKKVFDDYSVFSRHVGARLSLGCSRNQVSEQSKQRAVGTLVIAFPLS